MSFLMSLSPYDPNEKYKKVQMPVLPETTPTVIFKSKPIEKIKKNEEEILVIPEKLPVLERQQAVTEPEEKKKGPKNPRFKAGTEEAKEWSKMMIDKRREAKERKLKVEQEENKEKPKVDENENLVFKSK